MNDETNPLLWVGSQQRFDQPPRGFLVAVPVVLRRVIVEAPPTVQDSDPFARAVVNLAMAGVGRVDDIATLIGSEDTAFVNEVVRRLVESQHIKVHKGLIEVPADKQAGHEVAGDKNVWYLVQDTYTGKLWPRVVTGVIKPEYQEDRRSVLLGNPGNPIRRNFWTAPAGDPVDEPDRAIVKQTVIAHLSDLRTVGIKHNREATRHLATLGRPERRPIFSARLGYGQEDARLLVILNAEGEHVAASDPFEVGPWFELPRWTEVLLERSPALREKVVAWAAKSRKGRGRSDGQPMPDKADGAVAPAIGIDYNAPTRSRPSSPDAVFDRNSLLLSLADRLRADIARSAQRSPALSYDATHDLAAVRRRWASLGFRVPHTSPRLVPVLVERAAEGSPADIHDLFYAWTLMVNDADGRALAARAPNLPSLLYENSVGRTLTAIPDVQTAAAMIGLREGR